MLHVITLSDILQGNPLSTSNTKGFYDIFPGTLLLDDENESVLTDNRLTTCITLSERNFQTRAVVPFVLKKPYNNSVDILVHGRGMQCELLPKTCWNGYTTAVIQQGRIKHTCAQQPLPCPGAQMCTPLGMTSQDGGIVMCRFRCNCPQQGQKESMHCETVLFTIGNGARSEMGKDIEICSINME